MKKTSDGFSLITAFAEVGRYSKPQPSLMPDVDSTLRSIARWKYLITSDLTSAFYQIPLSKSSMKYCRVATPCRGVRVYTRWECLDLKLWSSQNVCEALIYLLDNICIRFGTKLYRQIVGIPMGTNCAPLVADLFLFCYERDFMTSLSDVKQAEIIEAFKSTSRYLDDLLNIDSPYFENMVNRIYPPEL